MESLPDDELRALPDHQLHERHQAGDEVAADVLYARYFQRLCGYAARFVQVDLAQDAVNEALLAVLRHAPLASEDELRRLAYSITRNKAIDSMRRHKRRGEVQPGGRLGEGDEVVDLSGEPSPDCDPETAAALWEAFHACQDGLNEVQREVFRQSFYGHQSAEVAAGLGRTAADVRMILTRAREKLGQCLESKGYRAARKEGRHA